MSESAVSMGEAGELMLSGVLDYRTGPALRKRPGLDQVEHGVSPGS